MDYLPIFALVRARLCLLVGGGSVALRKAELLCAAGASLRVVAPDFVTAFKALAAKHAVELRHRAYTVSDLDGAMLAIAATDDAGINARVAADADARRVLVNVVDDRQLSSFIIPSIVDRSPLVAAVSSSGASPVLARMLRGQLEQLLSPRHGELARFAERHRDRLKQHYPELAARRAFWEDALSGSVGELVLAGREREAERALDAMLADERVPSGEVVLIDCSAGEPDLLSLRAARMLNRADLVLYDEQASAMLSLCRRDAQRELLTAAQRTSGRALAERAAKVAAQGQRVCVLHHDQATDELKRLLSAGPIRLVVL